MILIKNATIVNEDQIYKGNVLIQNEKIVSISKSEIQVSSNCKVIEASGLYLLPGVIDDQVHFREPGLTHKAELYTESKAAVAGGTTSYMEMPNTIPQTINKQLLEEKFRRASKVSLANYSFYIGATNNNHKEILSINPEEVCGIKVFLGSSTGNMLVDDPATLEKIFSQSKILVAVHCEDEAIVRKNSQAYLEKYGEDVPIQFHSKIRSEESCYKASSFAVNLAKKHSTRLHVIHLSTAKELDLFDAHIPLVQKKITSEVCIHHLCFSEEDHATKGAFIKWNPSIKTAHDRDSLLEALNKDKIDVVATDHAPHLRQEKQNSYFKSPAGGPMVQHSLVAMLEFYHRKKMSLEKIVNKISHSPAELFRINKRGYIRKGYYADLVLVDIHSPWKVSKENILYKCKWSPFEGDTFRSRIIYTLVNGHVAYHKGKFDETKKGSRLTFKY